MSYYRAIESQDTSAYPYIIFPPMTRESDMHGGSRDLLVRHRKELNQRPSRVFGPSSSSR